MALEDRLVNKFGGAGEIRIGRLKQSTRRKPTQMILCLPQIPQELTCDRTRITSVGIRRIATCSMQIVLVIGPIIT
jgi:hypothetical protein